MAETVFYAVQDTGDGAKISCFREVGCAMKDQNKVAWWQVWGRGAVMSKSP